MTHIPEKQPADPKTVFSRAAHMICALAALALGAFAIYHNQPYACAGAMFISVAFALGM